jgi:hypothetical protein
VSFIRQKPKHAILALLAVAVAGGLLVSAGVNAQTDAPSTQPADKLVVGTYDPMQAFQAYPGRTELEQKARTAQSDARQAQQEGDQQKMMQISRQFQADRQRIIEQFQSDVDGAMPAVAKQQGVQVVVVQVVYTAPNVETRDVTQAVVKQIEQTTTRPSEAEQTSPPAMPWLENTE